MPMTREEILNEIRRTAAENGGKPLGRARFERVTDITEYEISKHWARFGDAQRLPREDFPDSVLAETDGCRRL